MNRNLKLFGTLALVLVLVAGAVCIYCGDGVCKSYEDYCSCPADCEMECVTAEDCGIVPPCDYDCYYVCTNGKCVLSGQTVCGDGRCEVGETPENCPQDCAGI